MTMILKVKVVPQLIIDELCRKIFYSIYCGKIFNWLVILIALMLIFELRHEHESYK